MALYTVCLHLNRNSSGGRSICTGRKYFALHLLFPCSLGESVLMQKAVLFPDSGSGDRQLIELKEPQFASDRGEPRTATARRPSAGWRQRIARALARVKKGEARPRSLAAQDIDQLSKGWTKRMYFADGGRILCRTGKVWITMDEGGEDIVLTAFESKSFEPGTGVLVEALAASRILVETFCRNGLTRLQSDGVAVPL
jgi:Protein of unknown function (DUF2917)